MSSLPGNLLTEVRHLNSQATVWLALWIWPTHFALPILLGICARSASINRYPTFINVIISYIMAGVSSCILLYTGDWKIGRFPSSSFQSACLAQASLLSGAAVMMAFTSMLLAYEIFNSIRGAFLTSMPSARGTRLWLVLTVPYAAMIINVVAVAISGSTNPDFVARDSVLPYCRFQGMAVKVLTMVFIGIPFACTVVLQVYVVHFIVQERTSLVCLAGYGKRGNAFLSTIYRSFAVTILFSMTLPQIIGQYADMSGVPYTNIIDLDEVAQSWQSDSANTVSDFYTAMIGTLIVIIFGTQLDLFRGVFRRTQAPRNHNLAGPTSEARPFSIFPRTPTATAAVPAAARGHGNSNSRTLSTCRPVSITPQAPLAAQTNSTNPRPKHGRHWSGATIVSVPFLAKMRARRMTTESIPPVPPVPQLVAIRTTGNVARVRELPATAPEARDSQITLICSPTFLEDKLAASEQCE